jgi:hypothetical protein
MGKDSGFIPRGARKHNKRYAGAGWFKPKAGKPAGRDGWKYRKEHAASHVRPSGCLVLALLVIVGLPAIVAAVVR